MMIRDLQRDAARGGAGQPTETLPYINAES